MAWTQSHTVLIRHRKLVELARALRIKPVYALGHLHALWHAALEQQEDGDLSSWSDDLLAHASCYDGAGPQYVSLLRLHGWLDGGLIHDWLDYAGRYLETKYRTSNPEKLAAIYAKHKKSDPSLTKDGPDKIDKKRLPLTPASGGSEPTARKAKHGSRGNGTNPRALVAQQAKEFRAKQAAEARKKLHDIPPEEEQMTAADIAAMRKALTTRKNGAHA